MSPLTTEETQLLREETQSWYTDLCNILRFVKADDIYGGHGDETAPDTVATDVKCMIESGAGQEQIIDLIASMHIEAEFIIALPAEQDVRVSDQLLVTTKGNLLLQVQAVLAPESIEIDRMVVANRFVVDQ